MKEFKDFLLKQNALALAVGVIIGGAFGKVVSSIVDNLLMPLVSLALPGGSWREAKIVLATSTDATGKVVEKALGTGPFFGSVIDFVIIAWVVYMITKVALKPAPAAPAPPTKVCPACKETVPADATRCRACTSSL